MTDPSKTLILAWGNPGRGDDGLGQALADVLCDLDSDGRGEPLTVRADYQLQIEDATEIARHDRVIFVDADRTGPEPFWCRRLQPSEYGLSFSSHSISPGALLTLAESLFGSRPEAWIIGIRGYEFDAFDEALSARARENLNATVSFLERALRDRRFQESPPARVVATAPVPERTAWEEIR